MSDYFIVLERTLIYYFLITIIYRIMGKREIGKLGIVDLIVSILIAELAAMSIDSRMDSIFLSIIPIMTLVLLEMLTSYLSLKLPKIKKILDGKPSIIIKKGIINFKEMIKQRYSLEDLLIHLRQQKIKSIEEVDYAILETNGKLSVFDKKDNTYYPLPIIINGKVEEDTLININKNKLWLERLLLKENINIKDIFYCFYKDNELFIIKNSDLKN